MRCILNEKLDMYCPGCGGTRAFYAFIDGDFVNAFLYNPFLFTVFIPIIVYIIVLSVRRFITGKCVPLIISSSKATKAVVAFFLGIWIFRNILPLGLAE
jgi:hypothetical protein